MQDRVYYNIERAGGFDPTSGWVVLGNNPPLELAYNTVGNSFRFLRHGLPWEFVKWHFHPVYELHQIVKTSGNLFIGDTVCHFAPGSLFLVGPNVPHNFVSDVSSDAVIPGRDLVIQFKREWIEACQAAMIEFHGARNIFDEAIFAVEYMGDTPQLVYKIFNRMDDLSALEKLSAFIAILGLLEKCQSRNVLGKTTYFVDRRTASLKKFSKVVSFVISHLGQEIKLADAAANVEMSYKRFSKWFEDCAGIGFRRFVINTRIKKSCEYLYGNKESVREICFRVGFNNVSNYNRLFLKIIGTTPSKFRKRSIEMKNINYIRDGY